MMAEKVLFRNLAALCLLVPHAPWLTKHVYGIPISLVSWLPKDLLQLSIVGFALCIVCHFAMA